MESKRGDEVMLETSGMWILPVALESGEVTHWQAVG